MHIHEPAGYVCPFCQLMAGVETEYNRKSDVVIADELAVALVSPRWWPRNPGHVLVVPRDHHENLYDLPPKEGHAVHDVTCRIAIAMRSAYGCTGISIRQHNEPDGGQDVWHYHVHVFPRYRDDGLYCSLPSPGTAPAADRQRYADLIKARLQMPGTIR